MDATQQIEDSFFGEVDDSDEEHEDGEGKGQREQLAVLKVFKNNHIPETEVPLYQGENVLGRDPSSCSVPLQARSVSGRHAIISVSVFGPNDRQAHSEATEALLWDLGSLNGTRKGRLKLTPHVRYALTDGDGLVLADLPCQYVSLKNADTFKADNGKEKAKGPTSASGGSERGTGKGAENGGRKSALPPVPVWTEEAKGAESVQTTPKKPEKTLVPESDSDSDGERHGRRDRKRIVVSDSGSSDLSSPTCSTFLTPANKVIPESEDESSITPSSTLKGRFLKTGNHTEVSSDPPKPDQLLFNIDSDTDVEDEEEEMTKDAPKTLTAEVDAATPADLHMDSDTDVEDDDEKTKSDPEVLGEPAKQDAVNPAVLNMDSDTDVEDNEPVKTPTTTVLSGAEVSLEEKKDADSSSGQLHLESDTDVEDEDDVSRIQVSKPPTSHVAEFNLNSDTDVEKDEDETTKGNEAESKDLVPKRVDSVQVSDVKMSHDQSDIDTDVEDDDTEIRTPATAEVTGKSPTGSENQTADASSTNAQPGGPAQDVAPFRLDSDTDVEEDEEKMEGKEQKCADSAVQIVHSSTPKGAGVSGEELETQAFLSPSQLFKRPGLPSLLHPSASPGGISHPDDDFAVAETQSFVCDAAQADATLDETPESLDGPESRHSHGASSFQLSLSDSSPQLPEAAEHDGEPAEEEWQLQATQLYAMKNSEGRTKAGEMQQDLDSTQAYVCATGQEEEEEEKEDGAKEEEEEETEPLDTQSHSSIHTAETQLIIKPRALTEDNSDRDTNEKVVASEPEIKAEEDAVDEMQVDSHLSTADTLLLVRSPRQEEQTQPYAFLTAQIQKEHEETEKEEHESRDLEDREDEGERAQEEGRTGMEKENELTREEEKKERGENETVENDDNEVNEAQTQPAEAEPIAETLPMCEEEEGQEEEQMNERRSSRGTQPALVESTQPLEPEDLPRVAVAETLPMCEEEDEQDEEQLNEPCSSRGTHPAQVESTQPLESIAETLPMCEEEEGQEEEETKPRNSRRPGRKRPTVKVETKQPVESDKVTRVSVAETQPMSEDDEEGQEEEQRSETTSTRRSSTRRRGAKTKPHVATPETLPLCEEEEAQEEAPPSEAVSGRKSRRGRQTAKVEAARAVEPDSTTETVKAEDEEEVQDSRRNLRGRAAPGKGKGRGRAAAEKEKRGKRGKREQDEDSEEEVERGNKGRGRKSLRLKSKDDDKTRLELMEAGKEEMDHVKKQEEEEESKRLQMEKEEEARDQLEREESARLEEERVEREEREKMERLEREKKEREEKEMKEREEMERLEREKQLEKERREQEEKDRLEQERIEKEKKEKEEKERLERELREKQELEKGRREQEEKDRLEKERIEKENREKEEKERLEREMREKQELEKRRREQEEKDRLEKEKRDRKEKEEQEKKSREEKEKQEQEMKQKESKDDTEDMEKEKRPAPGKRKAGLQRRGRKSKKEEDQELEEGTKEGLETEQELMQKEECEEGNSKKQEDEQADSDSKTRRGRRTTRKSVAPPAGAEDEGGPAKRTRSRSNSSNSVCSEQSAQDSLNGGRGEIRRTAQEQKDKGRPSGRRRTTTTTAPSSETEEIKPASNTRSNSRSSERSSSSAATPSRGRGRKRSVKVEETEEEERAQLAPVGRGRGRGGKHPGGNDIKEETAEKEKPEVMAVAEDGATCQSNSRGRKRGVDVSMPMEETPQPTPKTPRRSLAGQTHKVLFTGVVDEDGEKVVVRLGGGLAKGVADMTHLVTDKVRRTVKFLCAVARGVPIVTPDWLSKCGKAGSFLSPNGFLVKDIEQEKRFNFSLQEALRVASSQPLLQGYEIHVTPSVKPEPAHMKEIITCCGARFLPKMPSAHKAQTVVVVSCEEDRAACERARSLSFPVVSAEFLLTGILQQKVDLRTHALSLSPAAAATKPASRSRGK